MPTGYTFGVGDGSISTLRQFALTCARGMGACINMRDDPNDAVIPERFEPRTEYYDKRLSVARALAASIPKMSADECDHAAQAAYDKALSGFQKYEAERAEENRRYQEMIAAVEAWETDAEGIKDFMLQQLGISVSDYRGEAPKKLNGVEWKTEEMNRAAHDIGYLEEERAKEIARTEDRNRWLAALRASLPED